MKGKEVSRKHKVTLELIWSTAKATKATNFNNRRNKNIFDDVGEMFVLSLHERNQKFSFAVEKDGKEIIFGIFWLLVLVSIQNAGCVSSSRMYNRGEAT